MIEMLDQHRMVVKTSENCTDRETSASATSMHTSVTTVTLRLRFSHHWVLEARTLRTGDTIHIAPTFAKLY